MKGTNLWLTLGVGFLFCYCLFDALLPETMGQNQQLGSCGTNQNNPNESCQLGSQNCTDNACDSNSVQCSGGNTPKYGQFNLFASYGSCVNAPPVKTESGTTTYLCSFCTSRYVCADGSTYLDKLPNGSCVTPSCGKIMLISNVCWQTITQVTVN